jgi:DhnA family fructose-bisphosphate aldolase class Ia
MLNHGRLAGSGKMVILPVDQGFEHGPAKSFAPNPPAYDPHYHYRLAIKSGCNAYAAQLAAQLGAHVIKVKIPSEHIEQEAARKVYEECKISVHSLTERIQHVVQSCFNGRRVLLFSESPTAGDAEVFNEDRAIRDGSGFGSIIGRNSFQRSEPDALKFLGTIMNLYAGTQA